MEEYPVIIAGVVLNSGYRAGKAIAQGMQKEGDVLERYTEKSEDIINHVKSCMERLHFLTT